MKPKHKRLIVVLVGLACIFTGTFILLNNFRDNLIYFYPPKDIVTIKQNEPERFLKLLKKEIRVGGMIKQNSYKNNGGEHSFTITDLSDDLVIKYNGLLPPMFREGQGVVAQGKLVEENGGQYFQAKQLLTKHDEKYMPPEIKDTMKKAKEAQQ